MIDRETAIWAINCMSEHWNAKSKAPLLPKPESIIAALSPQWQDVATAPKDGTRIMLFKDGETYVGFWSQDWDTWGVNTKDNDGDWESFSNIGQVSVEKRILFKGPSHWQPLPEAPTQ